jgi:YVTN family beta-propeller protein
MGLWAGCGSGGTHVLYAVSKTTNQVTGYTISGSTLTQIATPVTTGASSVPVAAVAHPNGNFLYVADSGSNEVSVFAIDGSGALTANPANADAGSQPSALAIQPNGDFLYVADAPLAGSSTLTVYSVDSSSGSLTPITGSPFPLQFKPAAIVQDPVLTVLFAAAQETFSIPTLSTGAPEQYAGYSGTTTPSAIAIDSASRFLYVADSSSAVILGYTIASDGSLAELSPPFAAGGLKPVSLAIDPSGTYLFVANQGSNSVYGFIIAQGTGALTAIAGSPFPVGSAPSSLAFDNKSGNLYVANSGGNSISGFSMNSTTGVLTSLGAATATGATPVWLTVLDK